MKRRSFFQSLARAAAIIALAPQLAFRAKPAIDWSSGSLDLAAIHRFEVRAFSHAAGFYGFQDFVHRP